MTRTLLPVLAAGLVLAPGLAFAGDSAMVLKVDAIQYYYCTVNGGEEIWEDGDDLRTCVFDDGTFVWCDADYAGCEFVLPAPSLQAATSTSNTGTTSQSSNGGAGASFDAAGTLQLELAR